MAKGLTFSVVFKAMSLNYGESLGNISELKKLSFGDQVYTYMSRQAIRYELFRIMSEQFGMDQGKEVPLDNSQKVTQFKPDANIKDYSEVDLFGYMKTAKKENSKNKSKKTDGESETEAEQKKTLTRCAVVRITPAIALDPFLNDLEFGTNKNFADRIGVDNDIFQFEHHHSLYSYTIAVDLDQLGEDRNDGSNIDSDEKIKRIDMLLQAIQILHRNIKGRTENLNPIFVIGGVYDLKNPFFLGRIQTRWDKDQHKHRLNYELLDSVNQLKFSLNGRDWTVKDQTCVGMLKNYWANEEELVTLGQKPDKETDISGFFDHIQEEIKRYYTGGQKP